MYCSSKLFFQINSKTIKTIFNLVKALVKRKMQCIMYLDASESLFSSSENAAIKTRCVWEKIL